MATKIKNHIRYAEERFGGKRKPKEYRGIRYFEFAIDGKTGIYLLGTGGALEWGKNITNWLYAPGFAPEWFGHAFLLKDFVKKYDIVIGHSRAGAIAGILAIFNIFDKTKREYIALDPPPYHGWLNPLLSKHLTIYIKPDSPIVASRFALPYRYGKKPVYLPVGKFGGKTPHEVKAILGAMKRA